MKKLFLLCLLAFPVLAGQIQSLPTIRINPANNSEYQVTAKVHIVWEQTYVDTLDSLEAEEIVVATLKTLRANELAKDNSVDVLKVKLLQQLSGRGKNNKVQDVFVTQVLVEFIGQEKTIVELGRERPSKEKH
ncbi:hypothetical protein KJY73_04295 [Bowmanella sp. Y26]|uniref:hypothetical protein n=1 Tax=Bowmanella yangjiangensis TaxID=2811230 RepID=UPI001BDD8042|nr:hypothetical protein [Bowmanella yangjiangensis]MBT1062780.1 hypothetical protein [Bowmanella yangjiangensis]